MQDTKTILCFSGLDPSGGAGIQADIESIAAYGCHTLPIITCQTFQNSKNFAGLEPVDAELVKKQLTMLTSDTDIHGIKVGMLGSTEMVEMVATFISTISDVPVILDPVLRSGSGTSTTDQALREAIIEKLLPLVFLLTPNRYEAQQLTALKSPLDTASQLLQLGSQHVLVTGTDDTHGEQIEHYYCNTDGHSKTWHVPRLPGNFHGSGCTLAASIAARLACGNTVLDAIDSALSYTAHTLRNARQIGTGQMTPRRIF